MISTPSRRHCGFTPAATKIINLIATDIGRPVGHIVSNLIGYDKLVADIEELNARKATIKAKAAVAKTQSKVNEMTSAGDRAEGARSAFDRMEAKADEMLDRANAVAELSEQPADPTEDLAKKYAAAGAEAAVDDDLARLKKEMGLE